MVKALLPGIVFLLAWQEPPANPIDAHFALKWKSEGLAPASPANDYDFHRRLTIDLLGRLPTPDEIRAHIADKKTDKRTRLIDRLLASEECAEFMADLWLDILVDHEVTQQDFARSDLGPFRNWLRARFFEDTPYPDIVRALLSDRGGRRAKPAVNFSLKHLGAEPLPVKLAVMSARLFSNRDIRCAQCHDHPFEPMTQEEFWGYVEFFRPLRNRGDLVEVASSSRGEPKAEFGELTDCKPRFLDGRAPEEGDRLGAALAELTLTAKDRSSSRALVDRVWRHFFGRNIAPPNPKARGRRDLAEAIVTDFEQRGQSLRKLMRTIVTSQAYQLTSAGKDSDREAYAVGPLKLMGAVQFFNAFADIFNLHEMHQQMYKKVEESSVAGQQFKDPQVMKIMFTRWSQELLLPRGRDPEEAMAAGTVRMAIKFMNNKRTTGMMIAQWGLLAKIISKKSRPGDRVEELYLSLLGRPPSEQEKREYVEYLDAGNNMVTGDYKKYEDILWVLVNSSEFLFNR